MIVFIKYWLISGVLALLLGIKNARKEDNVAKIESFAKDFNMSERRTAVIFYAGFFVLGFVALPAVLLIKIKELIFKS